MRFAQQADADLNDAKHWKVGATMTLAAFLYTWRVGEKRILGLQPVASSTKNVPLPLNLQRQLLP
jgi:hypothetical protein